MSGKHLKKIEINGVAFILDHRYQQVKDLISSKFKTQADQIEKLIGKDDKAAKTSIDKLLKSGCEDDIAMTYFLATQLQNYGKFERAEKVFTKMYQDNTLDLLAKCAYANHLIFKEEFDKIPDIFNNTFDLDKVCSERELPLITFVQFMSIARTYYFAKNDEANCLKYVYYLIEAAPRHEETRAFGADII